MSNTSEKLFWSYSHIFLSNDALWHLSKQEVNFSDRMVNMVIDPIEVPYYGIFTARKNYVKLEMYERHEVYNLAADERLLAGSAEYDLVNFTAKGGADDEKLSQFLQPFLFACMNLSKYVRDNVLGKYEASMFPEEGGVMVDLIGDEPMHYEVELAERPELLCFSKLGFFIETRPYFDEILSRSMDTEDEDVCALPDLDMLSSMDFAESMTRKLLEESYERFCVRMMAEGKLSDASSDEEYLACLKREAELGDEDAVLLCPDI